MPINEKLLTWETFQYNAKTCNIKHTSCFFQFQPKTEVRGGIHTFPHNAFVFNNAPLKIN